MAGVNIGRSDVVWSYLNLTFSALVNILMLPFVLRTLSSAEVGVWYLFVTIGGLATILDFGFLTTVGRHVTYVWCGATELRRQGHEDVMPDLPPNFRLLRVVLAAAATLYAVIGTLAITLLSVAGTVYLAAVAVGRVDMSTVLIAWTVYLVAMWLNIAFAYWQPLLRGVGAVRESHQANVVAKVLQLILTIVGLELGGGLVAVSVSYLVSMIVFRALSVVFFRRYEGIGAHLAKKGHNPSLSERWQVIRTIWPNAYRQGIVGASQYLLVASPVFVATSCLGLEWAARFGLFLQVLGVLKVFANALFNAYVPLMAELRLRKDMTGLRDLFIRCVSVSNYMIFSGGVVLIVLGPLALELVGSRTSLVPILVGSAIVLGDLLVNQHTLCTGFIATGNRVPMHSSYLISALVGTALQFACVCVLHMGAWGIVLPALLVQLLYNDWVWPLRAARELRFGGPSLVIRLGTEAPLWFLRILRGLTFHISKKGIK